MTEVLIVDDERSILKTLSLFLKTEGYNASTAEDVVAAKAILSEREIDVVITDLKLKGAEGTELISFLQQSGHSAGCIVMTAYGSIESAVECVRLGAFDYLTKPVKPQELLIRVEKVLEKRRLTEEVARLRAEVLARGQREIVAKSPEMRNILDMIHRIRDLDLPVLITGETGTGKEVVAQAVHRSSRRAKGAFLAVNCCTLPEDLLDSELFGHAKGAFTGATSSTKGLFEQAHGGTLFLDEIGDISPRLQTKLLRVLQEGQVRPVGGPGSVDVDVRIIAATNRDLQGIIANGQFRADLFFRLNVVPINIPPLRERPEDLQPLIDRTVAELEKRSGSQIRMSSAALQKLLLYDYPGNVRQLENVLERTVALAKSSTIEETDVYFDSYPGELASAVEFSEFEPQDNRLALEDMTLRHIRRVLTLYRGNQVTASKALGISRSTLRRKLGLD